LITTNHATVGALGNPAGSHSTPGQPRPQDKDLYSVSSLMKNLFCKLSQFRVIDTRCDITALGFLGAIHLTATVVDS
jgi:hypothetical protein